MTSKPKICLVAATPLTFHFFFKQHIRQMSEWADVVLVCNKQLDQHIIVSEKNVVVKHIPIMRKVALIRDLWALILLILHIRKEKYDMVLTTVPKAGTLGMIAAKLLKTPVRLHIFQGEVWAARSGMARLVFKLADKITAKLATNILAVSHSERDFLNSNKINSDKHIDVLGAGSICGVDTRRFRPNKGIRKKQRNLMGIPESAVVALFLGRICKDKGVVELVEVFSKLARDIPNLWLIIAGPDEEKLTTKLTALVDKNVRNRLIIRGYCENPVQILNASDFLCLLSYREGFGLSVIEAAACAVPSLGSKIHGLSDAIVDGETGRLASLGDRVEIINAMRQLASNEDWRLQLGMRAQERAKSMFEQGEVIDEYNRYFRNLLHH